MKSASLPTRPRHAIALSVAVLGVASGMAYLAPDPESERPISSRDNSAVRRAPEDPVPADWPVLTTGDQMRPASLEIRSPAPRGALRVWDAPEDAVLHVEEARFLAVLDQRRIDFAGTRRDRTFVEFYGLDEGLRRGFLSAAGEAGPWVDFEVRAGELTELEHATGGEPDGWVLRVVRDGVAVQDRATLRLRGERLDHLVPWTGEDVKLPGSTPRAESVGIRFASDGETLRCGGIFPLVASEGVFTAEVQDGRGPLRVSLRVEDFLESESLQVIPIGPGETTPWVVDVIPEDQFRVPPTSYTRFTAPADSDGFSILDRPPGPVLVGVGKGIGSPVQIFRSVTSDSITLNDVLDAELPEPSFARTHREDPSEGGGMIPIYLGPWRSAAPKRGEAYAFGRGARIFGTNAVEESAGGTETGRARTEDLFLSPSPTDDRRFVVGQEDVPFDLAARWGVTPEALGLESLSLTAYASTISPDEEGPVRAETAYEISGERAGFAVYAWLNETSPDAPNTASSDAPGRARVIWHRPRPELIQCLQFPGFRIESTSDSEDRLEFEISAPTGVVVLPPWSGRPRGWWIQLQPGDVLLIDHG